MAWVKLDDQFFMHPKVLAAGRDARDLYLAGLTYTAGQLTDGYLPGEALPLIAAMAGVSDADGLTERLLDVRLLEETPSGYVIHDYIGCAVASDPTTQEQRKTHEYETWRQAVLKRDGYTCAQCGTCSCELHAHHIVPWAEDQKRRLDVSNGLTLCSRCHLAAHRGAS